MQAERSAPQPASISTPSRGRGGGQGARSSSVLGDPSQVVAAGQAAHPAPPAPTPKSLDEAPSPALAAAHDRILRVCSRARLPATDAQDIAQDVWLWLIESGRSAEAESLPWL